MAVKITNRAKKSIRNLYWRSTRKNIQRKQETKSLVNAMIELVNSTPLAISKESRGILGVWRDKGYTIYESTHCFVRYSNGIDCKPMISRKSLKRKWYFACVLDIRNNTVYLVNAVFARYIDNVADDTPSAMKFMGAIKGMETKRRKKEAETRQTVLQFPKNENKQYILYDIIKEMVHDHIKEHKNLLTESQESKSIDQAKKLLMQRMNYPPLVETRFKRIIRNMAMEEVAKYYR